LAPLIAGGFLAGVAIDWALREYNVYGADAPAEGLTGDVLRSQVYQTALTRESTNASAILANDNILSGVENTGYTEAKIAAIEALNAGETESAVLDAANQTLDSYQLTLEKNIINTWNEAVSEFGNLLTAMQDHPDISPNFNCGWTDGVWDDSGGSISAVSDDTITLVDGTEMVNKKITGAAGGNSPISWTINSLDSGSFSANVSSFRVVVPNSEGDVKYLSHADWAGALNGVKSTIQDVRNGISTWVTNVYGQVQSGEIEISDLVTPRERAAMMSEGEGTSQALADLIALNIPVDLEREATVFIPESGTTIRGSFGLTDTSDGPISAGTTYDPSTFAGDVYFTTDVSLLEGEWSAFETGVDGGTVTLTAEPYEGTVYTVETTAPETVNIPATDFTDNGDGTWSYDASGDLETTITEVSAVNYYAASDETNYQTIQLDTSFTVESFENTETGESVDSASFTSAEPQTDTNYITQEEWNDLEQKNQELINKFEESQSSGGGLFGGAFPWGDLGGAGGVGVLAVGGAVALGAIAILREAIKFYLPGR
nr:unknown [Halorubrum pleomorphic virus 3]